MWGTTADVRCEHYVIIFLIRQYRDQWWDSEVRIRPDQAWRQGSVTGGGGEGKRKKYLGAQTNFSSKSGGKTKKSFYPKFVLHR